MKGAHSSALNITKRRPRKETEDSILASYGSQLQQLPLEEELEKQQGWGEAAQGNGWSGGRQGPQLPLQDLSPRRATVDYLVSSHHMESREER